MNFFKHLNKKTKKLFFLSILSMVVWTLFFTSAFILLEQKKLDVEDLFQKVRNEAITEERLKNTKKLLSDTEAERRQLARSFVTEDRIVEFIERIELLARHSNIVLDFNSVDKTSEGTLLLSFNTQGGWENTAYFLSLVELLPVNLNVIQASVRKTDIDWDGNFNIEVISFLTND